MSPQISKNSRQTVDITDLTDAGSGLGHLDDMPVFVENALPGERVEIKVIKIMPTYLVGKLLTLITPASGRVSPFCPVFQRCGGCSLQHLAYAEQLAYKTQIVQRHFQQVGLDAVPIQPTLGMAEPRHYRNKALYPVGVKDGQPMLGFYAKRSHELIEHETCPVQAALIDPLTAVIREFVAQYAISVYDERAHRGLLRHVMVRVGMQTGEIMVMLVVNGNELPDADKLIKRLRSEVSGVKGIWLNCQTEQSNVIIGARSSLLWGQEVITETLGGYRFAISPQSFFQINPAQTETLYQTILQAADLTGAETVFDVYSGVGAIAVFLARHAKFVYGVEVGADAVADAARNAALNEMGNLRFIQGEAERVLPELAAQELRAEVVILDPPRKGCAPALIEAIGQLRPQRLVYVSCQPATLARDVKLFAEYGLRGVHVQPVDMFPHTQHVEAVATLTNIA